MRTRLQLAYSLVALVGMVSALLATGIVYAQSPRQPRLDPKNKAAALKHFKAGLKKYDEGLYQEAIKEYEAAYRLYPSPTLLANIGACYKYMAQNIKALRYYEKYLAATQPDSPKRSVQRLRTEATKEVKYLLTQVGRLRLVVTVPGALVKVAGLDRGNSPMDKVFRFPPGPVNVIVKKRGFHSFDRTVTLQKGRVGLLRVLLLKKIEPKVVVNVRKIRAKPARPLWKKWWLWTAVGAAVAGAVIIATSVVYGVREEEKVLRGIVVQHDGFPTRW